MAEQQQVSRRPRWAQSRYLRRCPLAATFEPHFDVVELLPPRAADKLRLLRQRRADAHAIVPPFEEIREASLARIEAENALKWLSGSPAGRRFQLAA